MINCDIEKIVILSINSNSRLDFCWILKQLCQVSMMIAWLSNINKICLRRCCFPPVVICLVVKMYSYLRTHAQAFCFKPRSQCLLSLKIFLAFISVDLEACLHVTENLYLH